MDVLCYYIAFDLNQHHVLILFKLNYLELN